MSDVPRAPYVATWCSSNEVERAWEKREFIPWVVCALRFTGVSILAQSLLSKGTQLRFVVIKTLLEHFVASPKCRLLLWKKRWIPFSTGFSSCACWWSLVVWLKFERIMLFRKTHWYFMRSRQLHCVKTCGVDRMFVLLLLSFRVHKKEFVLSDENWILRVWNESYLCHSWLRPSSCIPCCSSRARPTRYS